MPKAKRKYGLEEEMKLPKGGHASKPRRGSIKAAKKPPKIKEM